MPQELFFYRVTQSVCCSNWLWNACSALLKKRNLNCKIASWTNVNSTIWKSWTLTSRKISKNVNWNCVWLAAWFIPCFCFVVSVVFFSCLLTITQRLLPVKETCCYISANSAEYCKFSPVACFAFHAGQNHISEYKHFRGPAWKALFDWRKQDDPCKQMPCRGFLPV